MTSLPIHTPNFTRRRRRVVRSMLRETMAGAAWAGLSHNARTMYVVGALICDEAGSFTKTELLSAMSDEPLMRYAESLIAGAE